MAFEGYLELGMLRDACREKVADSPFQQGIETRTLAVNPARRLLPREDDGTFPLKATSVIVCMETELS